MIPAHTADATATGWSRSSGGPAPAGNGSKPVHDCEPCGAQYTGGQHVCRRSTTRGEPAMTSDQNTGAKVGQADSEPENSRAGAAAEPEADPDAELERLGVVPEAFHAANPGWRLMPPGMQTEMIGVIERHRQRAAAAEGELEAGQ